MIEPRSSVKGLNRIKDLGSGRGDGLIRLDKNERTVPFDERVFQEMVSTVSSEILSVYPIRPRSTGYCLISSAWTKIIYC